MTTETKEIMDELKSIKEELHYIKTHMVDVDTVLTVEERKLVYGSVENEKAGELASLRELKQTFT